MKEQKNKIEWGDLSGGKDKFIYYEYKFKNDKRIKKKIKFNKDPKKLQGASGGTLGIKIDKLFFEFKSDEQKALLFHELYHSKISTWLFKTIMSELKYFFNSKKVKWEEEFEADNYSALNNSVNDCLSFLEKVKILYKKDPSLYNPNTHPPIDERIRRIKDLI